MSEKEYRFWRTCVDWPDDELELLDAIIANARSVLRKTFLKRCDCDPQSVPSFDLRIGYYRSRIAGVTYYFHDQSAIEYVFRKSG